MEFFNNSKRIGAKRKALAYTFMYFKNYKAKSEVLLFGGVSLPYKDYLNDCWILTKNESSRY
jgi:hypothetical protein